MSRHHLFDPEGMAPARGFSYGAIAAEGQLLHLAGITGHRDDSSIDESLVAQVGEACRNVARVVEQAGGSPGDVVAMTIYTTVIEEYRGLLGPIGEAYREVFGRHYPAVALIGIDELFDPRAKVEMVCVAVVPGQPA